MTLQALPKGLAAGAAKRFAIAQPSSREAAGLHTVLRLKGWTKDGSIGAEVQARGDQSGAQIR